MPEPFPVTSADILLRRDLIAAGWVDRDIYRGVRAGHLVKVRYGAYVLSELVAGLDEVGMMRVRSRAVLRTAHPSSVLSHQNSLAEYGIPLFGVSLLQTNLTRTDGKAGRKEAGVVHHRGALTPDDWSVLDDVPVIKPARAAVEVALMAGSEAGLVAANGVLQSGLADIEELQRVAKIVERWSNSLSLRLVLARCEPKLQSVAEVRTWHLFHDRSIPRPKPQVEVRDERGWLVGIVDFLWREHGVFLEFDGRIKYERFRRPDESLEEYLMREKRREEQICQLTGWVCIRITWADLANPARTAQRIRAILESRRTAS